MIINTKYLVTEVGYEYDDEGYYLPSNVAVIPKILFKNKKSAEAQCEALNLKAFKECNPFEYDPYRWGEIDENLYNEITGKPSEKYQDGPLEFNDEIMKKLMDKVFKDLRFYKVVEIEES